MTNAVTLTATRKEAKSLPSVLRGQEAAGVMQDSVSLLQKQHISLFSVA